MRPLIPVDTLCDPKRTKREHSVNRHAQRHRSNGGGQHAPLAGAHAGSTRSFRSHADRCRRISSRRPQPPWPTPGVVFRSNRSEVAQDFAPRLIEAPPPATLFLLGSIETPIPLLRSPLHPPSKDGWSDGTCGGHNRTPVTPPEASTFHTETQIPSNSPISPDDLDMLMWTVER